MTINLLPDVPLVLLHEEPILLYIIDNEIFGCHTLHHWAYYGSERTLNVLYDLVSLPAAQKELPMVFQDFFSNHQSLFPFETKFNFIVGGTGYYGFPSLNFELTGVIQNKAPRVMFHSFQYGKHLLPFEVTLSYTDAFFVLANHCINSRRVSLLYDHTEQKVNCLELDFKKPRPIHEMLGLSALSLINQFAVLYSNYVVEQLPKKEFSLPYLLSRNGAGLITLLRKHPLIQEYIKELLILSLDVSSLTIMQQAQLYSVIQLNEYEDWDIKAPFGGVEKFFQREKEILNQFASNLHKYPPPHK
ncbi:MAG: hypothetical protein ACTSO7_13920 [Candidatus Heimdallarchaeota archaeon]